METLRELAYMLSGSMRSETTSVSDGRNDLLVLADALDDAALFMKAFTISRGKKWYSESSQQDRIYRACAEYFDSICLDDIITALRNNISENDIFPQ